MMFRIPELMVPKRSNSCSNSMPIVGMGTAVYPFVEEEVATKAILNGIKVGYRHFDTSSAYYTEQYLGAAISEALRLGLIESRDELFITSKLWCSDAHPNLVIPALQNSLRNLRLEYLDLYLIHWPVSSKPGEYKFPIPAEDLFPMDLESVWAAMEDCQKLGLTKSIGVSNFSCKKLENLLTIAKIPPAVNQVEMNPLWQQKKLREFCKDKGIHITGYSPLGGKGTIWGNNRVMECGVLHEIAKARGKSHAQICLRWVYEQGVSLLVKSFNEERMKANLEILDWELNEEDLKRISEIPQCRSVSSHPLLSPNGPFKTEEEFWDGEESNICEKYISYDDSPKVNNWVLSIEEEDNIRGSIVRGAVGVMGIPEVSCGSNNEKMIPVIGMGTLVYPLVESELKAAVLCAIKVGYRHFDTASLYLNDQPLGEAIFEAIQLGLIKSRDELFITSKLWCTDAHPDSVLPALQNTLRNLQLEYLDLYLVHMPISLKPGSSDYPTPKEDLLRMDFESVWADMEKCQSLGLTKSIGVSNFSCKKLEIILANAKIPPAVNQVEMNPYWQQKKLTEFCKAKGITITAFSPFGKETNNLVGYEVLNVIAKAKGKSYAQVCLRWVYQQGASILVRSFSEERMKENLEIFDWEFSEEDLKKISEIPQSRSEFYNYAEFVSPDGPFKTLEELWDGEI